MQNGGLYSSRAAQNCDKPEAAIKTVLLAFSILLLSCQSWGQSRREYIYLNSRVVAVENISDATAPVINNVSATDITNNAAIINWTTDEASDSQVEYGTTTSYGYSTTLNSSMVASHSQTLSGLAANTLYHYRVKSRDASNNLATSSDSMFTTSATGDTTPPEISGISSSGITGSSAIINWTTDEASNSQVEYGTAVAYGNSTTLDNVMVKPHLQQISGLSSGTLYHYRVKSRDAAGNLAVSSDYTFTTSAVPPGGIPAPTLTYGTYDPASNAVQIIWSSSYNAGSFEIDRSPSFAGGNWSIGSGYGSLFMDTNLAANTVYMYRVRSWNSSHTDFSPYCENLTVPASPTNLSPANAAMEIGLSPTLSWSAASGATSYRVYFGTNSNPPLVATIAGTTYAISGLATGTTYYWRIDAISGLGIHSSSARSFITHSPECGYSIASSSASIAVGGGNGTVNVTCASGCAWTATSNDSWITVTAGSSGTGNGTVSYSVNSNMGAARSGTITTAGQTFTINQASGCAYSLSATSTNMVADGGNGSFNITCGTGCTWTANANDAWITITGGNSGNGNGTVAYSIAANTGAARTGTITIAGQAYTISQASGCAYSISPPRSSIAEGGGTGIIVIIAGAGCTWTAASNDSWITVTSAGSGNGTASYTAVSNAGVQRSGTITIAGRTFTVSQRSGCFYSISPTNADIVSTGGTGSIGVTASAGCPWTATGNNGWITVTGGSSGNGSGTIGYSVGTNAGATRNGTITISTSQASDTTAPSISEVSVSNITANGATISWTTDEASDSQVEYGLSSSYGSSTAVNGSMVTSHSQSLTGLSLATGYHFRVNSKDEAGNLATSADYTFTTSSTPQPTSLSYSASSGFAGISSYSVAVGNGAGMTVDLKYNFTPWNSSTVSNYDLVETIGPMNDAGSLVRTLNQSATPGTYTVTAIRNHLNTAWVSINPVAYTIRPAKPTSLTAYGGSGVLTLVVGNGQNQMVLIDYVYYGEVSESATALFYLDSNGSWVSPGIASPGAFYLGPARNYLDGGSDAWASVYGSAVVY
jgi:hypothetical protein